MANTLRKTLALPQIDFQSPQTRLLIGLIAPSVMTGMAHHMFGVTLPSIREDFGLDADMVAWVSMIYTLPFIAFMPLYGKLGDDLGKQRLLLWGTLIFFVGAIMTMAAPNLWWLMLGRAIQGLGSAGFVPLSIAIIAQRFAASERGRVMGAWNSAVPLTGLIVPYIGGLLVDAWDWRAIYPLILAAALISLVMIQRNVPGQARTVNWRYLLQFDWWGVVLLGAALSTLLFYTSSRPITGVESLQDWRLLALCLALFGVLIWWERRCRAPYFNLRIFANAVFTIASFTAGLRMFLMSSISFLIPLYMDEVHQSSATLIGVALALQAGSLFLVSRYGGELADRWGSRRPVVLSMGGLIVVTGALALLPAGAPIWLIMVLTTLHGFVIGISLAPLHRSAMHGVADAESGSAAGVYSMIRFAGTILGTAMAGVLLQRGLTSLHSAIGAYQMVFWFFTAIALAATLLSWRLRD
ncbi:MAG: MFS transporter [Caldilineaceae bacterium]